MKISKALVLSLGVSLSSVSFANSAEVVEARALAKQFMGQLKPALGAAMKSGGPVHAISVCKDKAPAIAQNLSESSGWDLKRVSLKNRSPIAEP
ncbi:MAG: glutamate synthase, partial [Piscirickettsiaceae bacterium CG07_land_8_20_14_0_80_44_28]